MSFSPLPQVERPAYFDGQRLTAADLTSAADYSRAMRQLHNRALHGWGVVSRLGVTGARGASSVHVDPGFALDCSGRELLLVAGQDMPVPPVAQQSTWYLVISAPDDPLTAEERTGACETDGAVRLLDVPLVRWLSTSGGNGAQLRPGLDVVLAEATVANCLLADDVDTDARQALIQSQPYVTAGQTDPTATVWSRWPSSGKTAGVMTTVSTATGGFRSTPSYQARLAGARQQGGLLLDGPTHIEAASAASFDFCVDLSGLTASALQRARTDLLQKLQWHVVWMGVETS